MTAPTLNASDKEQIKRWCKLFNAKRLWIEGKEVNVPLHINHRDDILTGMMLRGEQ